MISSPQRMFVHCIVVGVCNPSNALVSQDFDEDGVDELLQKRAGACPGTVPALAVDVKACTVTVFTGAHDGG